MLYAVVREGLQGRPAGKACREGLQGRPAQKVSLRIAKRDSSAIDGWAHNCENLASNLGHVGFPLFNPSSK